MKSEFDLIIVGGGLVGTSLAIALAPLNLRVALIEAKPLSILASAELDTRTLALSLGTVHAFSNLGLWESLQSQATPIQHIHVSDRGRFGASRLHADRYDIDAFGFVVRMPQLQTTLQIARESCSQVSLFCPAEVVDVTTSQESQTLTITQEGETKILSAKLLVAADGANSSLRQLLKLTSDVRDYDQMAVVTNLALARSHEFTAYERFTPTGPLALLPVSAQQVALIWTLTPEQADHVMKLDDAKFLEEVQHAFGYRAGRFTQVGKRLQYPLKMTISNDIIQPGIVFIGNASQQLHPIAGQGFNLGLRDVMGLVKVIQDGLREQKSLNNFELLQRYQTSRSRDKSQMIAFTETLARLFTNPMRSVSVLRDLGMMLIDRAPWLQAALVHRAMGLGYVS